MTPMPITLNGYDTYYTDASDSTGNYLLIAIPTNAGKDISNICGTLVCNHLINQVDYKMVDNVRFIKAYY